jgi:hypothetical protein
LTNESLRKTQENVILHPEPRARPDSCLLRGPEARHVLLWTQGLLLRSLRGHLHLLQGWNLHLRYLRRLFLLQDQVN